MTISLCSLQLDKDYINRSRKSGEERGRGGEGGRGRRDRSFTDRTSRGPVVKLKLAGPLIDISRSNDLFKMTGALITAMLTHTFARL